MSGYKDVDVQLSDVTIKLLNKRKVKSTGIGCFLCSLILTDIEKHGKLTGYPFDYTGGGTFLIESKIRHITLERTTKSADEIVVPPAAPYPEIKKRPPKKTAQDCPISDEDVPF